MIRIRAREIFHGAHRLTRRQQCELAAQTCCRPADQEVIAVLCEIDRVAAGWQRAAQCFRVCDELRRADFPAAIVRDAGIECVDIEERQFVPDHVVRA